MFDLGVLTSLDQGVALAIRDIRRIGPDVRIVARVAQSSSARAGQAERAG
jgi:hypothetical protein